MADLNNITPMKGLPPFLQYFRTIGIIPASYKVTMTYEEQVLELMRFIRDEIIPKINENVLATQELQEKFKELVIYVNEYFENLDIQEEVNIKLNEMAESGQLSEIISEYIQLRGVLAFNTVLDMKNADNITNGSICYTLGKNNYNDGLGFFYKVRTVTSEDIVDEDNIISLNISNTLIAEKILSYLDNFYNDIYKEDIGVELKSGYSDTVKCYYNLLKIQKNKFNLTQKNTNSIPIYELIKNDSNKIYSNGQLIGAQVINGIAKMNPSPSSEYWYILGIDNNGNVKYTKDITRNLSAQDLIDMDYKEAFGVWHPILINNVEFDAQNELPMGERNYNYIINQRHTRTIFAWDNENYYILTVEGRLPQSIGINFNEEIDLCRELNLTNAFNLDGGGSTQLWFTNEPYNCVYSDSSANSNGYSSRNVWALIEFEKKGD